MHFKENVNINSIFLQKDQCSVNLTIYNRSSCRSSLVLFTMSSNHVPSQLLANIVTQAKKVQQKKGHFSLVVSWGMGNLKDIEWLEQALLRLIFPSEDFVICSQCAIIFSSYCIGLCYSPETSLSLFCNQHCGIKKTLEALYIVKPSKHNGLFIQLEVMFGCVNDNLAPRVGLIGMNHNGITQFDAGVHHWR